VDEASFSELFGHAKLRVLLLANWERPRFF